MEDLEEFCNVERRLEGGDGLAPGSFGKWKWTFWIFCFCLDFLLDLFGNYLILEGFAVKLGLPGESGTALSRTEIINAGCRTRETNISYP